MVRLTVLHIPLLSKKVKCGCARGFFSGTDNDSPPISYVKKRLNFKRLSLSVVLIIIIMFLRTPSPLCVFRNRFFGKLGSPVVSFFWFCGGACFGIELHVGSPLGQCRHAYSMWERKPNFPLPWTASGECSCCGSVP